MNSHYLKIRPGKIALSKYSRNFTEILYNIFLKNGKKASVHISAASSLWSCFCFVLFCFGFFWLYSFIPSVIHL